MRRLTAVVVAVTMAGVACTDNGDETPDPTVPTAVSTLPPTTVAGIDTIPEVIDAPYLNRVLAALDSVGTAAIKVVAETQNIPQAASEIFNSIYSDEWFPNVIDAWIQALQDDASLSTLKRPLGDRHTTVERLIEVSPSCIWMAVRRDYSDSDVDPPAPRTEYIALQPLDPENDPKDFNPTAWMITTDGFRDDGTEPRNPCPA